MENVPALHKVQLSESCNAKLPIAQFTQPVRFELGTVPALHGIQLELEFDPNMVEYRPGKHKVQVMDAMESAKVPLSHKVQLAALMPEKLPSPHGKHAETFDAPKVFKKVPAAQLEQFVEPTTDVNDPGSHN